MVSFLKKILVIVLVQSVAYGWGNSNLDSGGAMSLKSRALAPFDGGWGIADLSEMARSLGGCFPSGSQALVPVSGDIRNYVYGNLLSGSVMPGEVVELSYNVCEADKFSILAYTLFPKSDISAASKFLEYTVERPDGSVRDLTFYFLSGSSAGVIERAPGRYIFRIKNKSTRRAIKIDQMLIMYESFR